MQHMLLMISSAAPGGETAAGPPGLTTCTLQTARASGGSAAGVPVARRTPQGVPGR
jgi:hypothetical protein